MMDSEAATLRRELVMVRAKLDDMKNRIHDLEKKEAEWKKEKSRMQARLALYESPNMPTSRPSLYNA